MNDLEEIIVACSDVAFLIAVAYAIKNKLERDLIERICIGGPL